MLSLPEPVQIYFCTQPTDMRKGFDTLAALVRDHLGYDPLSGHLFVFRSRLGGVVPLHGVGLVGRRQQHGGECIARHCHWT